jgi:hypothetical protein
MNKKIKYILFSILGIALFIIGIAVAFMIRQQESISQLSASIDTINKRFSSGSYNTGVNNVVAPKIIDSQKKPDKSFYMQTRKDSIVNGTKEIKGLIIDKASSTLSVEAEIIDLVKLETLSNEDILKDESLLPKTKKVFSINVNSRTQYQSISFEALDIGMKASIMTDQSLYQAKNLTAEKIYILSEVNISENEERNKLNFIAGQIKKTSKNSLSVIVKWLDYSKINDLKNIDTKNIPTISKSYNVLIDKNTLFPDKSYNEYKTGDNIKAFSDLPVYQVDSFTATKITGPLTATSTKLSQ